MQPPLSTVLGFLGIGEVANQILLGTYQPPANIDPYARQLIPHLAMPPSIAQLPPIATFITTSKWIFGWQRAKKRTSSGPSLLHFGQFKAGCLSLPVADFEATMASIPLSTGYSPTRWHQGINIMLLKRPGKFQVDKLCTILLYEPDFNHVNKFLGRAIMHHAEDTGFLAKEQYGSRQGKSAITHALHKRLTFDIL